MSVFRALLGLAIAVVLIGPAAAAYVYAPDDALRAWPALVIIAIPAAAGLLAAIAFHAWRPRLEIPLPTAAAAWLRAEIERTRRIGISVAAMEKGKNEDSFYHPASQTIVLADDVYGEHTARAHATAAHELGHALFHIDRPTVSRVLLAARTHHRAIFHVGAALLAGAMLAGGRTVQVAALALIVIAMVLQALVVVDEAIASSIARRLLREHLGVPEQGRAAAGLLRRALATYGLHLAGTIVALVLATWVAGRGGDGVLDGRPPLEGVKALAAIVTAGAAIAGVIAALVLVAFEGWARVDTVATVVKVAAMLWCPLLAALLCDQPGAPRWTVALAVVPAWTLLSIPPIVVVTMLARGLGRDLAHVSRPMALPVRTTIRRIGVDGLVKHEEPDGVVARLLGAGYWLWSAPLALWWLA